MDPNWYLQCLDGEIHRAPPPPSPVPPTPYSALYLLRCTEGHKVGLESTTPTPTPYQNRVPYPHPQNQGRALVHAMLDEHIALLFHTIGL